MADHNFNEARAIVVGIADYLHFSPLQDSVSRDATDIGALLTDPNISGYDPDSVSILVDAAASAASLREALRRAALEVKSEETFLFFFSGHGAVLSIEGSDQTCLMPQDANPADLASTTISAEELFTLLADIKCERQVIILDACHSGGVGALKSMQPPVSAALPELDFNKLGQGRGRVLLCSSRSDEVSLAPRGMANSVFTSVLLDGLRGGAPDRGDGVIGVFDLFSYVSTEVPKIASQTPIFKADQLEENFAIARRPKSEPHTQTIKTPTQSIPAQVESLMIALYPLGPTQDSFWQRAGGDMSRLSIAGHGAGQWHAAIRHVQLGGGLDFQDLLQTATSDYPKNKTLREIRKKLAT